MLGLEERLLSSIKEKSFAMVIGLPQFKRKERSTQLVVCDLFVNFVTNLKRLPMSFYVVGSENNWSHIFAIWMSFRLNPPTSWVVHVTQTLL